MHNVDWAVAAGLSLLSGPVMFLHGFRSLRMRQLIQNTPTARIRSMAMGLVEVNGSVVQRSALNAPFSDRPCAYWEVDIATRGKNNSWTVVHRNASGHPFFLRDDTGLALVYPKGAVCKVMNGVAEDCNGITLPECYAQYMSDQNLGLRHVWRLSQMRFRERILEEGQRVYVLGTAMPRSRALDISGGEAMQATGTDDASGGRVRHLTEESSALIRQGENERTFIISQESERALALELGWEAMAKLAGGPALTLFGLGYWLLRFASGHKP